LPGASTSRRSDEIVSALTVGIRLRLNASAEMINTGRRASAPDAWSTSAHQMSPRRITSFREP
jgi:hypothetical protein